MTVKVLCLAQLRGRIGGSETAVPLPNGATGRDLLRLLKNRHPQVEPLLEVSRLAVNCEYVPADAELHDGDEVVIIPPVSGG
ncbi:MAG: MoaD/ThiS family protein [Candidatus Omnitrophica bacterium]|nr:MoaD/ThiS family protein [Candidatus Omnitrophota bacterium]